MDGIVESKSFVEEDEAEEADATEEAEEAGAAAENSFLLGHEDTQAADPSAADTPTGAGSVGAEAPGTHPVGPEDGIDDLLDALEELEGLGALDDADDAGEWADQSPSAHSASPAMGDEHAATAPAHTLPKDPAAGRFDHLGERIHSSDTDAATPEEDHPASGGAPYLPAEPEDPLAGQFDHLGERIHSSDAYPPASPVMPEVIEAGDEGETLRGSGAGDTVIGGAGDDTLVGAGGNSVLIAGSGNNHLIGSEGDDALIGGAGDDTLQGGWGDDLLIAGGGDNLLMGGAGNDTLIGAALDAEGRDISGANLLNGGAGDDLLIAGQGDMLHGGEGTDVFALGEWLAGQTPATILDYSAQEDQITLHYDPDRIDPPSVSVSHAPGDPATAEIRLEGQIVAYVANAPELLAEDIRLVAGLPAAMLAAE